MTAKRWDWQLWVCNVLSITQRQAATWHRVWNLHCTMSTSINILHFQILQFQWHSINFIHLFSFVNGTWHTRKIKCELVMSYMAWCTNFDSKYEFIGSSRHAKLKICLEFASVFKIGDKIKSLHMMICSFVRNGIQQIICNTFIGCFNWNVLTSLCQKVKMLISLYLGGLM